MRSFYLTFVLLLALAFVGCGGDSSQSVDVEYSSDLALSSEQEPESSSLGENPSSSENSSDSAELSSSSLVFSSSSAELSSSSVESSSSSLPEYTCKFSYGTMTDERDGHVYRTVTFNPLTRVYEPEFAWVEDSVETTWMIENLNYAYLEPTETLDSSSECNDNCVYYYDIDCCEKYGRRYLWSAAMDSAAIFSEDAKGCGYGVSCSFSGKVRGICPEGWHVPNEDEWYDFKMSVYGVDSYTNALYPAPVNYGKPKYPKDYFSKTVFCENNEAWNVGLSFSEIFFENVSEDIRFERMIDFRFASVSLATIFWEVGEVCVESFDSNWMTKGSYDGYKDVFQSLRCVKDRN